MPGEGADGFLRGIVVVGCVDGGGRADHVHQSRREHGRGGGAFGEENAVKIGEGRKGLGFEVAVEPQPGGQFGVGLFIGDGRGAREVAEEGHIRKQRGKFGIQTCNCQRNSATLTEACRRDAGGVNRGVGAGGTQGADGVSNQAAVVIGLRAANTEGEHACGVRLPADVWGIAGEPVAALTACVKDEGGKSSGGIEQPAEPSNDAVQRYLLLPSKCLFCLSKPHTYQSGTTTIDRHQTHRCNTISLWELGRRLVEWLPEYEPRQLPNSKYNGFCDLQP